MRITSVVSSFVVPFLCGVQGFLLVPRWKSHHPTVAVQNSNLDDMNPALELTNTLARLDRQWKLQQRREGGRSRWVTLRLDEENTVDEVGIPLITDASEDVVYLLEPPNKSLPSCIIVFVGGAGLGTYPQIAYNELLLRLSNRLNAAVLTVPYNVGLDHFQLAQETGERLRRAVEFVQDNAAFMYPKVPVYCLSHSLGGKLVAIHMAATTQDYAGIAFLSFNNFSFGQTVGMAKEFAAEIQSNMVDSRKPGFIDASTFDQMFSFAEMVVSAIGVDFTPTAEQMDRIVAMKYDEEWQSKTRLVTFDDDKLQNTQSFVKACTGQGPTVSQLPGTHLTPVYFEIGLDQIPDEQTKSFARQAMGGFEKASFGNEEELQYLVDEICDWIFGKPPSRQPVWKEETPLLSAAPSDDQATGAS